MARDAAIGLEVAFAGGIHDAGRQRRGWRVAVPPPGAALRVEVVAERLLVEARLRLTWLVHVLRPESRTVGCHHLVDQDDAAILVPAELEFGIGDDDATLAAEFFAERIDCAAHALRSEERRVGKECMSGGWRYR